MEGRDKTKKYHDDIKSAVALRYDKDKDAAPTVVAAGRGWIAEKILDMARDNGVHIHQDRNMAESLMVLKPGEEIPVEMYEAVATILAFVFQADRRQESHQDKNRDSY